MLAAGAPGRDRVLVLVTDGQVGNEDQILRALKRNGRGIRTFALGIDRAVNEAFLRRLADLGGHQGGFEVVESEERLDEVMELFPILKQKKDDPAGSLSGGQQQMVAIGRALMGRPKVLLLDEPSLGLAPLVVKQVFEVIRRINEAGTTVLLAEQNAYAALKIADRAYVLERGRIVLEGDRDTLLNNDAVRKAYIGA